MLGGVTACVVIVISGAITTVAVAELAEPQPEPEALIIQ
jgi:hypothetical protein